MYNCVPCYIDHLYITILYVRNMSHAAIYKIYEIYSCPELTKYINLMHTNIVGGTVRIYCECSVDEYYHDFNIAKQYKLCLKVL